MKKVTKNNNYDYINLEIFYDKEKVFELDNEIILPLVKKDVTALDAIFKGGIIDKDYNFITSFSRNLNDLRGNLSCDEVIIFSDVLKEPF